MSEGHMSIAGALALVAATVVGCAAAGNVDPSGAAGGTAGGAGALSGAAGGAGTTAGGGGAGTGGSACVTPPVAKMAWTIVRGVDGSGPQITCDAAGATTVQLLMNSVVTEFPCNAGSGTSKGLAPGIMSTPRVVLAAAQGPFLSQGNLAAITIPSCGVYDLGRLIFLVSPTGAGGTGGTGGGGAGGSAGAGGTGGGAGGSTGAGGGTGACDAMPIFAVHSCAAEMACHDAKGSAASFNMKTTGWEKNLVGVSSKTTGNAPGLGSVCGQSGMPYLVAGSSPASGLFLDKLRNAKPACGAQMPLIPPNLTPQELDCVQRWANGLTKK
jgi:fibronectin-binding autotransporter adhesin